MDEIVRVPVFLGLFGKFREAAAGRGMKADKKGYGSDRGRLLRRLVPARNQARAAWPLAASEFLEQFGDPP